MVSAEQADFQPTPAAGERGATLPELLIGLVISAAIIGLIGTAVYQLFITSSLGNARLTALHNLQNASLWLNRDTMQSRGFTSGSGNVYGTFASGDPTILYRYSYDQEREALTRERLINGSPEPALQVARHIREQTDVVFTVSGDLLTINVTATADDGATYESVVIQAEMRVD
jgi:hypothetical protein